MHTRPSSFAMLAIPPLAVTTTRTRTMGASTRLIQSCKSHKGFLRDLAIGTRPHMDPGAAAAVVRERLTSVARRRLRSRPPSKPRNSSSNNRCLRRRRLLRPRLANFLRPRSSANWICRLRPPLLMLPTARQQHPRSTLLASILSAAAICPHSRPLPRPNSRLHRCPSSSSSSSSSKPVAEAARRVKSTHRCQRHWALATPIPTAPTVHSQPKRPQSRQRVRHVAVATTTKRGTSGGGS